MKKQEHPFLLALAVLTEGLGGGGGGGGWLKAACILLGFIMKMKSRDYDRKREMTGTGKEMETICDLQMDLAKKLLYRMV